MNFIHGYQEDFARLDAVGRIVHLRVVIILQRHDDLQGGMPVRLIAAVLLIVPDTDGGILMELDDLMSVSQFPVSGPVMIRLIIIKIILLRDRYCHMFILLLMMRYMEKAVVLCFMIAEM